MAIDSIAALLSGAAEAELPLWEYILLEDLREGQKLAGGFPSGRCGVCGTP